MSFDVDRIAATVNAVWDAAGWAILAAAAVLALLLLVLAARLVVRTVRVLRRVPDVKLHVGFAVVQAGVTVAVITGVYEFFTRVLRLAEAEAVVVATFLEATVWVAVGLIYRHARRNPDAGLGPAGPFFWVATVGGGALAVLGSTSVAAALGRAIIVSLGAYMWWLRIREVVPATGARSRWRWTPRRLLLAVGALAPEDADLDAEGREWQIRRLTRAIARANGRGLVRRLGERTLARRAVDAPEDVIDQAYRRFAAAWLARTQARVGSERMQAAIAAVAADASPGESPLYVPDDWTTHLASGDSPAAGESPGGAESPASGESPDADAPANGESPPAVRRPAKRRVTRRKPADPPEGAGVSDSLVAQARGASGDAEVRMAWLWHTTAGRASGRQLAAAGDVSRATGIRRAAQWRLTPPPDPRDDTPPMPVA